jgi:hypothetical protein
MAEDILSVELQATDKGSPAVATFKKNVEGAAAEVNKLGNGAFGQNLEKAFVGVTTKVNLLRDRIRETQTAAARTDSPIWKTYETGAQKAADQARVLHGRIIQLREQASRTNDPKLFESIKAQARSAEAEIDKLDAKMRRVVAGRAAVAQRQGQTPAAAPGQVSSAAGGLSSSLLTGLGIPPELAALVPATALITAGAAAAAGLVFVKYTQTVRDEAEKTLKIAERAQVTLNNYFLKLQEIANAEKKFQEARTNAANDRAFGREQETVLGGSGDQVRLLRDRLQREIDILKKPTATADDIKEIEKKRAAIIDLDAALEQRSRTGFTPKDSGQYPVMERNIKAAAEAQKAFNESVKEGKEKVKELTTESEKTFRGLFAAKGESNPFVKVYREAEEQIERVRKSTRFLSADLQKQAEDMAKAQNAAALFSARLDNRLSASDLRADAERFRGGGQVQIDKQIRDAIARLQKGETQGVFRNIEDRIARSMVSASAGLRVELFDQKREIEESGGLFRNPDIQRQIRSRFVADADRESNTAQQRIERQLSIIESLNPKSDAERAIAERRIIALTAGMDPTQFDDRTNRAAAGARENEATRLENQEKDAIADRKAEKTAIEGVAKDMAALLKIAESEGLTGVIRIIDETDGKAKVTVGKRPTPEDAAQAMTP